MKYTSPVHLFVLLTMLAACCATLDSVAQVNPSKNVLKSVEEEFNLEARYVRPDHPLVPSNFFESSGITYYYVIPRRLERLSSDGHSFTIKNIRYKTDYVDIEFVSDSGAKPRIRVYTEAEINQDFYDNVIPGVLRDLFDFKEPWFPERVVGNSQSMAAHWAGSNHLPSPESRIGFPALVEAETAGYTPCRICFDVAHWIPLEGYMETRKSAIEKARLRKLAFPPVPDEDLQSNIQDLGEKIISGFPIPTLGYDYEFMVLQSEIPWAMSYPTGFVFVSNRLMEMIEDPLELEFVLAHEIGHVELYIKEIAKDPFADSNQSSSSYLEYYERLRALEKEVDLISLIYLASIYKDPRALRAATNVLRKFQYFGGSVPEREAGDYDSHATLMQRVKYLENNFFTPLTVPPVFCDLDDGGTILTAEVLGLINQDDITRLYIRITATDLMNKEGKVRRGGSVIGINGVTFTLNRTDYPQVVGRNQSRIFTYDVSMTPRFKDPELVQEVLTNISELSLGNIGGASDWEPCEGSVQ